MTKAELVSIYEQKCPKCGDLNTDNWPLRIDGKVVDGGCQMCWEAECAKIWWEMVKAIYGSAPAGRAGVE